MPCQFLDPYVNAGRKGRVGGNVEHQDQAEAASTLAWWLEAGVDVAVQDTPRNWLKPVAQPAPLLKAIQEVEVPAARQLPESLDLFRDWLRDEPALPFAASGSRRVLPVGKENPRVMLLTDSPGKEGSSEGRPIGGDPWLLAQRMLASIGIDPAEAYCASFSCFHTIGSALGGADLDSCADIARHHIRLARPERLLILGDVPAKALIGKPVASARGHVHKVEGVRTVATFHPSTMMNYPSNKELAWADLLLLMEEDV